MKNNTASFVKAILMVMAVASITTTFMPAPEVFADPGGSEGGGGDAGGKKCYNPDGSLRGTICTRYGAEWRYYPADRDDIYIQGVPGTMASSGHIVGCKTYGGGYYRYGMVAYASSAKYGYVAGDQVGLTAIGGGPYRSVKFGGSMAYAGVGGGNNNTGSGPGTLKTWDEVMIKYLQYQAQFPGDFRMGWTPDSPLSWFCAEPPKKQAQGGNNCAQWKPGNVEAGYTSVLTMVKNDRLKGGYGGWRHAVEYNNGLGNYELNTTYAKPGDKIDWIMCYWPGAEKNKHAEAYSINGVILGQHGAHNQSYCYGDENTFVELKDTEQPPWPTYFEYIAMTTTPDGFLDGPGKASEYGEPGLDMIQDIEYTDWADINEGDVGRDYFDAMFTDGEASKVATTSDDWCRWQCTYHWSTDEWSDEKNDYVKVEHTKPDWATHNKIKGTFIKGPVQSSAHVKVPYNFTTDITAEIKDPGKPLYSGTDFAMKSVTAHINDKSNGITEATYKTAAPGARIKAFAYVADSPARMEDKIFDDSGEVKDENGNVIEDLYDLGCSSNIKQCVELESTKQDLNPGPNPVFGEANYVAFDANAGDWLCVVGAMTPFSSGDDTNIDPMGFNWSWIFSEPSCRIIAKKPFFQVWGGDMYSANGLDTSVAKKNRIFLEYMNGNVINPDEFAIKDFGKGKRNFASWVEEGLVIKDGTTGTVASGTASGFAGSFSSAGTGTDNIQDWSPLTLANSGTIGNSGIESAFNDPADREKLINYWLGADTAALVDANDWQYVTNATGATIRYIKKKSEETIPGMFIDVGQTYLLKTDDSVEITGNITYTGKELTRPSEIPKLVIYAGGDVNISCGVGRIDAIIIANGTVRTCSNATDNDVDNYPELDDKPNIITENRDRDNQLKIFGIVIANNIELGRTYAGSAWDGRDGVTSDGIAAEIFDYDASIPIWSEFMAGAAQTDTLQTVYQHELAPRY